MQKAIDHLKASDPVLAAIIDRVGPFSMSYHEPDFSTLVRSIAYQQLSVKAAATILNRVIEVCGGELTYGRILKLRPQRLRACGLSKQKLSYVRSLAKLTATGQLDFGALPKMSDEDVIASLTQVK